MDPPDRKVEVIFLSAILLVACATRFVALDVAPPVINPDEASNGYDAYCIYKTGKDRWGHSWPVLLEAYGKGDWRPALATYLTVPFVALLGTEHFVWATRLPAATCGVLTIACLYALVRRVSDPRTALWAAGLMTCSPWHIHVSRFGHESSLTPGFVVFALYALSRAGWPLGAPLESPSPCPLSPGRRGVPGWAPGSTDETAEPVQLRWPWFVLFGVLVALSPYAYASMKVLMPAFLLAGGIIYRRAWRQVLVGRRNLLALVAGVAAACVVIAPMAWLTITQWDRINARAFQESVFRDRPVGEALKLVALSYSRHFGMNWLFIHGHQTVPFSIPGVGELNWYELPLLPLGLFVLFRRWRSHRFRALLIAWLLLHPIASVLCTNSPHSLRAACGIPAFAWIGAMGATFVTTLPGRAGRRWAEPVLTGVLCVVFAANTGWALRLYDRNFARHPFLQHLLQTDLRDAVVFLRDRWRRYDRIFISDHVSPEHEWPNFQPYIYVLMFLPVEPDEFQAWPKRVLYPNAWDPFHVVQAMGPFTLSTQPQVLDEHFRAYPQSRVLFVARPGDIKGVPPVHVIRDSRGAVRFEIIEVVPKLAGRQD